MKLIYRILIAIALFCATSPLFAQGFHNGDMFIGPHIGLAAYGGAPAFGANFEIGIGDSGKIIPGLPGIFGVSGRVDYFGYSDVDWRYSWVGLGVFANYHFPISDNKWDPFLGVGLGYENVSSSWVGEGSSYGYSASWGSGLYFAGNAGVRYFFSPAFDARAQAGFGITWLVLGVDFKLNSSAPPAAAIITQ